MQSPGSGRVFKDPLLIRGGDGVDARARGVPVPDRRAASGEGAAQGAPARRGRLGDRASGGPEVAGVNSD